jgi:mercuric ion binding protein
MKNPIKYFMLLLVFLIAGSPAMSQDTLKIATSAQCASCKKLLEHDLRFEKGVESVSLDVATKVLTVAYNPAKTNPEKIKKAVTKIGYDADELPADPKAYQKLNDCCKKGGHSTDDHGSKH